MTFTNILQICYYASNMWKTDIYLLKILKLIWIFTGMFCNEVRKLNICTEIKGSDAVHKILKFMKLRLEKLSNFSLVFKEGENFFWAQLDKFVREQMLADSQNSPVN